MLGISAEGLPRVLHAPPRRISATLPRIPLRHDGVFPRLTTGMGRESRLLSQFNAPTAGPCTVLVQRNSALVVHWEAKETFASTKSKNPIPPARMLAVVGDMIAVVSGPSEASIHMCRLRQPPPSVEEEHSIMSALNVKAQ